MYEENRLKRKKKKKKLDKDSEGSTHACTTKPPPLLLLLLSPNDKLLGRRCYITSQTSKKGSHVAWERLLWGVTVLWLVYTLIRSCFTFDFQILTAFDGFLS